MYFHFLTSRIRRKKEGDNKAKHDYGLSNNKWVCGYVCAWWVIGYRAQALHSTMADVHLITSCAHSTHSTLIEYYCGRYKRETFSSNSLLSTDQPTPRIYYKLQLNYVLQELVLHGERKWREIVLCSEHSIVNYRFRRLNQPMMNNESCWEKRKIIRKHLITVHKLLLKPHYNFLGKQVNSKRDQQVKSTYHKNYSNSGNFASKIL